MKRHFAYLFLFLPLLGYGQLIPSLNKPSVVNPVKWSVAYSKKEVKAGEKVDVIITAEIEEGWYLYALGDPPHASIEFVKHPSFATVGKVKEGPGVKEKYDDLTEINVRYYLKKAEFRQTVTILAANPVIEIDISGQVCSSENTSSGSPACVLVRKNLQAGELKVIASAETSKNPYAGKTDEPKEPTDKNPAKGSESYSEVKVKQLEKEKEKLSKKNSQGKDESIEYLKNFVKKYGGK